MTASETSRGDNKNIRETIMRHSIAQIIEGKPLVYVGPDDPVRAVAKRMAEKNIGAVAVLDQDTLVGIFTERDLMIRVIAMDQNPDKTRVSSVMTTQIVAADPNDSINECIQKMQQLGCRHLPVVDGGRLIGMLSLRDLLKEDADEQKEKVDFLSELVTYSADYES
jgi:CBS domain-containing protein